MSKQRENSYLQYFSSLLSKRRILLVFIIVLLVPFPTTIVPEWKIKAVDKNGNPSANAKFRQSWAHYSYDIYGQEFRIGDKMVMSYFPDVLL